MTDNDTNEEDPMPTATKTTKPAKAAAKKTTATKSAAARKTAATKKAAAASTNGTSRMKMSDDHKTALAVGRDQGRMVRRYLEALSAAKPKRGRQRTPETMRKRLTAVQAAIQTAEPFDRLLLIQERIDLEAELAAKDQAVDLTELETGFIEVGADFAARKNISHGAFVELGVSPDVLKRAGISRS